LSKFPDEIERATTPEKGLCTPIGYAFLGRNTEIAKWLIQMGAQNLIHNAIQIEFYNEIAFDAVFWTDGEIWKKKL